RARNLQKAARLILEKYQGKVPDSVADLLTLPGIGEYTAGAIASIAFGKNSPAIDGNVLRVICRLTENRGDIRTAETKSAIRAFLQKLYPTEHCGDFTQSLMELGATVCRPNGLPLCECCPIAAFCQSHRHGSALQIPVKAQKKARKIEKMTVLLLHADGKIAIRRRPDKGLLAGLWEFPMLPGWPTKRALSASLQKNGLEVAALSETLRVRHIFSHLEWHMRGWHADCTGKAPDLLWVTPQEINTRITLPTAFQAFKNLLLSPLLGFNASSSPIPFANETRR
ncbi:MAG: NUDIX domain-containing protein, partial [Lentisphaeria bacterium]